MVVKKFRFAISSADELLCVILSTCAAVPVKWESDNDADNDTALDDDNTEDDDTTDAAAADAAPEETSADVDRAVADASQLVAGTYV